MKLYLSSEGLGNKRYILEEWKKQNDAESTQSVIDFLNM